MRQALRGLLRLRAGPARAGLASCRAPVAIRPQFNPQPFLAGGVRSVCFPSWAQLEHFDCQIPKVLCPA